KVLDWRLVLSLNAVYGSLRPENKAILAQKDINGNVIEGVESLSYDKPYVEVGYGVDNIFKLFRVDFFHRLTYLDKPVAKPFGIKFSVEIKL
ncbi:MAG: carboxypeptidase-like regulatory domain-containing protein, partial [Thermonemataceae bacterium]|nr:carboxypeptidase-like regulatory domain-containing protein [Thermonemataceae bacterium]